MAYERADCWPFAAFFFMRKSFPNQDFCKRYFLLFFTWVVFGFLAVCLVVGLAQFTNGAISNMIKVNKKKCCYI